MGCEILAGRQTGAATKTWHRASALRVSAMDGDVWKLERKDSLTGWYPGVTWPPPQVYSLQQLRVLGDGIRLNR